MLDYVHISVAQLFIASALLAVNLGTSALLKLGLGRRLVVAAARMVAQLLLVGFILEWLFSLRQPVPIVLVALLMATLASVAAVRRTKRRFPRIYLDSLLSILVGAALVSGFGVAGVLRIDPWFDPQYLIPLLGMILGNALTGISLALDRFLDTCVNRRDVIEMFLCHGATRWEAAHDAISEAVRTGTVPLLNSMAVMGIVSLPGMMTGQILAGAAPEDAVRYQIVIMFMIASCTAIATVGIVLLAYHRVFSNRAVLRTDLIKSTD